MRVDGRAPRRVPHLLTQSHPFHPGCTQDEYQPQPQHDEDWLMDDKAEARRPNGASPGSPLPPLRMPLSARTQSRRR